MLGMSNILKAVLVLAVFSVLIGAAMLLGLSAYLTPQGATAAPVPDPFTQRLSAINEEIYFAGSSQPLEPLRTRVQQLGDEIEADGGYSGHLTLTSAQLMAINVMEAYFAYVEEADKYASEGIECGRDYSSLYSQLEGAASESGQAKGKIDAYLSAYPESNAAKLTSKLETADTAGMGILSQYLKSQYALDCPPDETPGKAYPLPLSRDDAIGLAVSDVVGANDWYVYSPGASPLHPGTIVSSVRANGTFDREIVADTWFFFVDTEPEAPFSHESYFVFIDAATAEFIVTNESHNPVIDGVSYFASVDSRMDAAWRVYPDPAEGNLTYGLSAADAQAGTWYRLGFDALAIANVPQGTPVPLKDGECCRGAGRKYALVVTGYDEPMFRGDTENVYAYLKGQGYSDANINYLTTQPGAPNSDGQTTIMNLFRGFGWLAASAQCCDEVFIYLSGHGSAHDVFEYKNRATGEKAWTADPTSLSGGVAAWQATGVQKKMHKITMNPKFTEALPAGGTAERGSPEGGDMWDAVFNAWMSGLKSCDVTVMYFSCFSGAAGPNLEGPGRTIITPVGADTTAWGARRQWQGWQPGGFFTQNFINAKTNATIAAEADRDGGGVSDKEAFDWAKKATADFVKALKNKTNEAVWTGPEPCRCCHVDCNESTDYLCIVVEGNGTDCPDCKEVGEYCGPTLTPEGPDDSLPPWEELPPGTGGEQPPGTPAACGDGVVSGAEKCDHGSVSTNKCPEGSYCRDCDCRKLETSVVCGDGKISSPNEDCDGGNVLYKLCPSGQECRICKCVPVQTQCGDGSIGPGEECDHGNTATRQCPSGEACTGCQCLPFDEVPPEDQEYHLECVGEACRVVEGEGEDWCMNDEDCLDVECGDGDVEGNEQCEYDDDCQQGYACVGCQCREEGPECGDGDVDGWEECEDDNDCGQGQVCDDCLCWAVPAYCGDGTVNGNEQCDPEASPSGCNEPAVCGGNCQCVSPPSPNCNQICSYTSGAQAMQGTYTSESQCLNAVDSYYGRKDCFLVCKYAWYYEVSNIAGEASCCCGMKKEFACSNCPCTGVGCEPTCPGEDTCERNAPSWYSPPN